MQQAMLKFVLILLIGFLNLPKTTPYVPQYGQCGGIGWNGETTCCSGSTCTPQSGNPYYSQCLPIPSPPGYTAVNGQCGGIGWSGSTCCWYSTCVYSNPWYSQCLPGSCSPGSPSSSCSSSITTTNAPASSQSSSSTSSSTSTASTSSSSTTASTSSSSTAASTSSSSTSATNQGCSILYAPCGGIGWNGPTICCSGSTCIPQPGNPYYSQCLPSAGSTTSSGTGAPNPTTAPSGNVNGIAGVTTRYWDCCKVSCGWPGKASVTNPVETCASDGVTIVGVNTQSGCNGGTAYTCNNQQPWNVSSTLSYGYAAVNLAGETESDWCCACYSLIFTSGPVIGKQLIVQVTNTGGDVGGNQFDLQIPGGGVGIFTGGCPSQFGTYNGGMQYGGVSSRSDCAGLPPGIQAGCYWRFDWFMNANNPTVSFTPVTCPSALTSNTQCIRL